MGESLGDGIVTWIEISFDLDQGTGGVYKRDAVVERKVEKERF